MAAWVEGRICWLLPGRSVRQRGAHLLEAGDDGGVQHLVADRHAHAADQRRVDRDRDLELAAEALLQHLGQAGLLAGVQREGADHLGLRSLPAMPATTPNTCSSLTLGSAANWRRPASPAMPASVSSCATSCAPSAAVLAWNSAAAYGRAMVEGSAMAYSSVCRRPSNSAWTAGLTSRRRICSAPLTASAATWSRSASRALVDSCCASACAWATILAPSSVALALASSTICRAMRSALARRWATSLRALASSSSMRLLALASSERALSAADRPSCTLRAR